LARQYVTGLMRLGLAYEQSDEWTAARSELGGGTVERLPAMHTDWVPHPRGPVRAVWAPGFAGIGLERELVNDGRPVKVRARPQGPTRQTPASRHDCKADDPASW
jgi:hypothetical protein